ncbi:hypothetical protein IVB45_17390 [Bradyrhizobium sp. 4]|uniref:hypothetical protein n=1 Tax=unclassified Bradyrhizobium TaxID=2631580 RepID=UPI001FF7A676|nr:MULTISPECIES: hypothetical protein [unclassified Bradyrhizobium]MCK1402051.1 hypothetical protein [Bradyrhizobium sp. 39]MCK1751229.1 hypothetical protein [Bradyrhizobium sp. 135]UPJ38484.1 hypothetical protein IVB45_17390 [Bradyrhizobium sp. 4]
MPSGKVVTGDTVYVRATAEEVASDGLRVLIDSGNWAVSVWVPARECARHEDIGELKPIRRANPRHIER